MMPKKLSTPLLTVYRASDEDDKGLEVQVANPDLVLWDETRVKHKWPPFEDAKFLWLTFLAWAAARRTGKIPVGLKWEEWKADVMEVTTDDDEDSDSGNPTREAPAVE